MIEVVVARLGLDSSTNSYVLVLQEKGGDRLLPIWIGQPEAESIVMQMHNLKRVRPLTHDLCKNLIQGMGIFAAETLLSNMTIETAEPEESEPSIQSGSPELDAEQLKSYLEQLRPEDFGKFNP
jgi:hypothetical protein